MAYLKRSSLAPLGIFVVALIVRVLALMRLGIHRSPDSTFYQTIENLLTTNHYDFSVLISHDITPFYWLYPTILAVLQGNELVIILAQILFQALAAVMMYSIGKSLFGRAAGLVAGGIYSIWWEILQWDIYVLTDSFFVGMVVLLLFLIVQAYKRGTWIRWAGLGLTVFLLAFLRPTALLLIVSCAWFILARLRWQYRISIPLLITISLILGMWGIGVFESSSHYGVSIYWEHFQSLFAQGTIIDDRPEYLLPAIWEPGFSAVNVGLFFQILTYRLIAFWLIWVQAFSLPHILYNILFFVPVYFFAIHGLIRGLPAVRQLADRAVLRAPNNPYRPVIVYMAIVIASYWIFHSFTQIDYDWRYRLPTLPLIVLFAAYGFSSILEKNKRVNNRIEKERLSKRMIFPGWVRIEHQARFIFASRFTNNATVIDCACGNGQGSRLFAERAKEVRAYDISDEALTEALKFLPADNLFFQKGDAYHIPVSQGFADVYISLETIEHLQDEQNYLREVYRVICSGGIFVCSTPNRLVTNPGKTIQDIPANVFHVREYSADEFERLLKTFFSKVEIYGQNPNSSIKVAILDWLGKRLPRHVATRIHQLTKLIASLWRKDEYYTVQKIYNGKTYEYLTAVCYK